MKRFLSTIDNFSNSDLKLHRIMRKWFTLLKRPLPYCGIYTKQTFLYLFSDSIRSLQVNYFIHPVTCNYYWTSYNCEQIISHLNLYAFSFMIKTICKR